MPNDPIRDLCSRIRGLRRIPPSVILSVDEEGGGSDRSRRSLRYA